MRWVSIGRNWTKRQQIHQLFYNRPKLAIEQARASKISLQICIIIMHQWFLIPSCYAYVIIIPHQLYSIDLLLTCDVIFVLGDLVENLQEKVSRSGNCYSIVTIWPNILKVILASIPKKSSSNCDIRNVQIIYFNFAFISVLKSI